MKHIRKAAFLLALLVTVTSLAGCKGGGEEVNVVSNGSPVTLNGDDIYPVKCDDTLTYWFSGTAIWSTKYTHFGETPLGKEIEKKSGVKVEYMHPTAGQENEQFQIMLASNELPDIANSTWYSYAGGPDVAISDDYIYALNDIIEKYCPAFSKILKEKPEWEREVKTDAGTIYAFPSIVKAEPIPVTSGPMIRKDYLEKVNMDVPRNIDEWEKVLTAFKEELGIEAPYAQQRTSMTNTFGPAFGFIANWYIDDGTVKYGLVQPQYKDFLIKMNQWYEKGLIEQDFVSIDSKELNSNFLNGKSGSTTSSLGSGMGTFLQTNADVEGFDLVAAPYPAMGSGTGKAEYASPVVAVSMTGTTTAITKNCKNVELAARFLDFGYAKDGDIAYNFGVEGESFKWVDKNGEKYPEFTDLVVNNPEGLSMSDVLHSYTRAAHLNVPFVLDPRYSQQYYQLPQQQNALKVWADTNMENHVLPTIYLTPEQAEESSNIMVNVNTYIHEMSIKFITGVEPIEKFDEFMKEVKNFGIDKATQYRQEAYDRYINR